MASLCRPRGLGHSPRRGWSPRSSPGASLSSSTRPRRPLYVAESTAPTSARAVAAKPCTGPLQDSDSAAAIRGGSGVAVNGDSLYWTQCYDSANPTAPWGIMKVNLDDTSASVIDPDIQVFSLAADASNRYWSGHDINVNPTITQANFDGCNAHTVVLTSANASPLPIFSGVAISSSLLYWSDVNYGTIGMADLDGSSQSTMVSGTSPIDGIAIGCRGVSGISTRGDRGSRPMGRPVSHPVFRDRVSPVPTLTVPNRGCRDWTTTGEIDAATECDLCRRHRLRSTPKSVTTQPRPSCARS